MAIFGRKKKSQSMPRKIIVLCRCKQEGIEVFDSDVETMPTGYKGRLSFYVECPHCGNKIYIGEEKLSKSFVRKMYRKTIID